MRFALSLFDYNILERRPHFPGYPVFCFITKFIHQLIGSVQYTFSIVGAIATFIVLVYSSLTFSIVSNKNIYLLPVLLFISPLLWIMSNRYMSDLLGLSLLMVVVYYLLSYSISNSARQIFMAFFVLGTLAGVRISFLPFFIPLTFFVLAKSSFKIASKSILSFVLGVLIWIIPLIIITGLDDLYYISQIHIDGHFNKWGGSILTSNFSFQFRLTKLIESVWADGMGGFWPGRNPITFLVSIGWLFSILFSFRSQKLIKNKMALPLKLIILSIITYFIWIFLFQNIVYKPRHIIPFIPFITMVSAAGFDKAIGVNKKFAPLMYVFTLSIFATTTFLNIQHKDPSAISQVKSYIVDDKSNKKVFCSSNLINNYVKKHNNSESIVFINIHDDADLKNHYNRGFDIFSTKNLNRLEMDLVDESIFYHNPYVNRLWSTMRIYKYRKKD